MEKASIEKAWDNTDWSLLHTHLFGEGFVHITGVPEFDLKPGGTKEFYIHNDSKKGMYIVTTPAGLVFVGFPDLEKHGKILSDYGFTKVDPYCLDIPISEIILDSRKKNPFCVPSV